MERTPLSFPTKSENADVTIFISRHLDELPSERFREEGQIKRISPEKRCEQERRKPDWVYRRQAVILLESGAAQWA